jgi:hypothetical protein
MKTIVLEGYKGDYIKLINSMKVKPHSVQYRKRKVWRDRVLQEGRLTINFHSEEDYEVNKSIISEGS